MVDLKPDYDLPSKEKKWENLKSLLKSFGKQQFLETSDLEIRTFH